MEPKTGEILGGKYRLLGRLGQGGMGAVYEGEHINLRQPVAVKVLLPTYAKDPTLCKRFVLEAQAASRIEGEHVVRVFDVDQVNGTPFLVMERLDGESYADRLERAGVMPVQEVADALLQAMEALAQAHSLGIVHRDIKPGNLFAARLRDGREVVKVLDFGIASAFHGAENGSLTGKETILGSLPYMSPEHCKGARFATPQSDVWSLGITAYELVAGVTPFPGDTMVAMFNLILQTDAPPLSSKAPHVPAAFSDVIAKSLERDPSKRYGSVLELARAFAPFATLELAKTMIPRIEGAVRTMTASGENLAVFDDETLGKAAPAPPPDSLVSLVDSEPEPATQLIDTSTPGPHAFEDPNTERRGAGPYPSGPGMALGATMESGSHPGGIAVVPASLAAPTTPRMLPQPAGVSSQSDSFLHPIAGPTVPAAPARSWLIVVAAVGAVFVVLLVVVVVTRLRRVDTADLPPPNDSAFSVSPPVPSAAATLPSVVATSLVVESTSPSSSGAGAAPSAAVSATTTTSSPSSSGRPRPRPSGTAAVPAPSGNSGWAKGRDGF